jgi:prephenate dehydrogenase
LSRADDQVDRAPDTPYSPVAVAVIGLGLMGGSLARELTHRGARILVHDSRRDVVEAAVESLSAEALDPNLAGVGAAEVVIIATPVDEATKVLDLIAPWISATAVVTDLGSTKESICRHAESVGIGNRFVGSHPLTGDHRSGWSASRLGLFTGAQVFLCPTPTSTSLSLERVRDLWVSVGAACEVLNPTTHDHRMAWASHLPQVASSALALSLRRAGLTPSALGPGGRDMVRLAASSPDVWGAICLENRPFIGDAVDELQRQLADFREALNAGDAPGLRDFFRASRDWHLQLKSDGNDI